MINDNDLREKKGLNSLFQKLATSFVDGEHDWLVIRTKLWHKQP